MCSRVPLRPGHDAHFSPARRLRERAREALSAHDRPRGHLLRACAAARCWACWARTAPARPPRCTCCSASCMPTSGSVRLLGADPFADRETALRQVGFTSPEALMDWRLTRAREPARVRRPLRRARRRGGEGARDRSSWARRRARSSAISRSASRCAPGSRARCCTTPRSWCSTSPPRASTRTSPTRRASCCCACAASAGSPSSTPRTTWPRSRRCATG